MNYKTLVGMLAVAFAALVTAAAVAGDGDVDAYTDGSGIEYRLDGVEATVVSYGGSATDLAIPVKISTDTGTYYVVAIDRDAFRGNSTLNTVFVPLSVKVIGAGAFMECTSLKSINVDPSNAIYDTISGSLFSEGGASLIQVPGAATSLNIPKQTSHIYKRAFVGCDSVKTITVDVKNSHYKTADGSLYTADGTTLIRAKAGTSHFAVPENVTEIAPAAFYGSAELTTVSIPYGVKTIGESAFHGCFNLVSLKVPSSVTLIDRFAFERCSSLDSVTLPDTVSLGYWVFQGCNALRLITVTGDTVTDYSQFVSGTWASKAIIIVNSTAAVDLSTAASGVAGFGISDKTENTTNHPLLQSEEGNPITEPVPGTIYLKTPDGKWKATSDRAAVIFDSAGDTIGFYAVAGMTTAAPADPVIAGKRFAGWYSDLEFTKVWDADTIVNSGVTTVYAKWFTILYTIPAGAELAYNGEEQTGVVPSEGYVITENVKKNAGDYIASVVPAKGYEWADGTVDEKTVAWKITPVALTIKASDITVSYYSEVPEFGAEYTGLVGEDTPKSLYGEPVFTCMYVRGSNVGDYEIAVEGPASPNYVISFARGVLTVIPADIVATVTPYDGIYDADAHSISVSVSSPGIPTIKYGETAEKCIYDSIKKTNAGTYTVYYRITMANYNTLEGSSHIAIEKGTIDSSSIRWGDGTREFKYEEGKTVTIGLSGNLPHGVEAYRAGVYRASASGTYLTYAVFEFDEANYHQPDPMYFEWKIVGDLISEPEVIEGLVYNGESMTGVMNFNFDGTSPIYTVVYGTAAEIDAGAYQALVAPQPQYMWRDGTSDPIMINWSISKAVIDMSAFGWDYAESFVYDGKEKKVDILCDEKPFGITSWTVYGNVETKAGKYTATVDFKYDERNFYPPEFEDLVWEIKKADIVTDGLQWNHSGSYTYNGSEQGGFTVVGELPVGITGPAVISGNTATNAGKYVATATFPYDSENYNEPVFAPLKWEILKADIDVSGLVWDYETYLIFDGTPKTVLLTGDLPVGVSGIKYGGNSATATGYYTASARPIYDSLNYNEPEAIPDLAWEIRYSNGTMSLGGGPNLMTGVAIAAAALAAVGVAVFVLRRP